MADQLRGLLEAGDEFVLAPPVELELLRGPQGEAVAELRSELEAAMEVLAVDGTTFALAADAVAALASTSMTAHRKPVADLVTAALAHQHGCGIVHLDADFEEIASVAGLEFPTRRVAEDLGAGDTAHPAARQRGLKRELAQALHQLPIDQAEACLVQALADARARAAS